LRSKPRAQSASVPSLCRWRRSAIRSSRALDAKGRPKMSNNDWKEFEKIVAGIHSQFSENCHVTWDEEINGRQFDVVVRSTIGPHKYLVHPTKAYFVS